VDLRRSELRRAARQERHYRLAPRQRLPSPCDEVTAAEAARVVRDAEALSLLAMSHGLGTSVLGGQSSAEQAQAVIDYHLDRLFPVSRPALRRAPVTTPRILVEGCCALPLLSCRRGRRGRR
jgi:hypothetical protein